MQSKKRVEAEKQKKNRKYFYEKLAIPTGIVYIDREGIPTNAVGKLLWRIQSRAACAARRAFRLTVMERKTRL